jgi:deoxyribodipyrimidine photolyase-related protein
MNMMMALLRKMDPELLQKHQAKAQDVIENPEKY